MIRALPAIRQVLVLNSEALYLQQTAKQLDLFRRLNQFRESQRQWTVTAVSSDDLAITLEKSHASETLLVIPAGPSSQLEASFTESFKTSLSTFLHDRGGRLFTICGSSYALCLARAFNRTVKFGKLPLFEGTAHGPFIDHEEHPLQKATIRVTNGKEESAFPLIGGGTLRSLPYQELAVLLKYVPAELERFHRTPRDWENAAILTSIGRGAAVYTMPHPEDLDNQLEKRIRFVYDSLVKPLEPTSHIPNL